MIKLFSTNKNKKLAVSTVIVSILAIAALLAVLTAASSVGLAYGGSSGTGAVYIIDNSASGENVLVYARGANGQLGVMSSYPTMGTGTGAGLGSQGAVVLTQGGHWLLVVDAGSNQISVFGVQDTSLVFSSITGSEGTDPISLAVSGDLVYVLNAGGSGSIAGFTLSSGVLTYIPGSTQPLSGAVSPSPEQIGFNPQGNVLVVTEKGSNIIDTYTVGSNGVASAPLSQASAGAGPYAFAFTNPSTMLVSEAATNTVTSYTLSNSGYLTIISGAIPTFGLAPCWLEVENGAQFAFTANAHGGTISTFTVSNTGGLTLYSSIAAHTAIPTLDMAFSRSGQFLYVRNGNTITGFSVFPDGSISSINSVTLPASAAGATGLAAN